MYDKHIYVLQPKEQIINENRKVKNPFYDSESDKSFYSFDIHSESNDKIEYIYLAIDERIEYSDFITIQGRKSALEDFVDVSYEIYNDVKMNKSGMNYLKIRAHSQEKLKERTTYRITMKGLFPPMTSAGIKNVLMIDVGKKRRKFDSSSFIVPKCPQQKNVLLRTECYKEIRDNKVFLNYKITINNYTCKVFKCLQYNQDIFYCSSSLQLGAIKISNNYVKYDLSEDGRIKFYGNFPRLNPRDRVQIDINVEVKDFLYPGTYNFPSFVKICTCNFEKSETCNLSVGAYEVTWKNKCIVTGDDSAEFKINIVNERKSPDLDILLCDSIYIPKGVYIQFTDISWCSAVDDMGNTVDLYEKITDKLIFIKCKRRIKSNSEIAISFKFRIIGYSREDESCPVYITNTVEDVVVLNGNKINVGECSKEEKVYLRVSNKLTCFKAC